MAACRRENVLLNEITGCCVLLETRLIDRDDLNTGAAPGLERSARL